MSTETPGGGKSTSAEQEQAELREEIAETRERVAGVRFRERPAHHLPARNAGIARGPTGSGGRGWVAGLPLQPSPDPNHVGSRTAVRPADQPYV